MSRKRLSRTVIEGGRVGSNKWERRHSHRTERANERAYLADISKDLGACDVISVEPKEHVRKEFRDKLRPMARWLRSNAGRPWDEVRSEVFKTFDTRTTAGRHITFDHLLQSVEEVPDLRYGRYYYSPENWTEAYREYQFYVDEEGTLREKTKIPRGYKIPKFDTRQIANWLSGRVVGKVGNKFFWFVPADKNKKRGGVRRQWRTEWNYRYYFSNSFVFSYLSYQPVYKTDSVGTPLIDNSGNKIIKETKEVWTNATPYGFRQDRKLNDKEMAYWDTIPEYYQTKVLERSPTYPKELQPAHPPYYY